VPRGYTCSVWYLTGHPFARQGWRQLTMRSATL
jgi:hypothetical protein